MNLRAFFLSRKLPHTQTEMLNAQLSIRIEWLRVLWMNFAPMNEWTINTKGSWLRNLANLTIFKVIKSKHAWKTKTNATNWLIEGYHNNNNNKIIRIEAQKNALDVVVVTVAVGVVVVGHSQNQFDSCLVIRTVRIWIKVPNKPKLI